MKSILGFLGLGPIQAIVIGIVLGGLTVWIGSMKLEIADLEDEVAILQDKNTKLAEQKAVAENVANANAATLVAVTADYNEYKKRSADALRGLAEARAKDKAKLTAIETEIRNAPASEDAPVAPVLQRALDRLRTH